MTLAQASTSSVYIYYTNIKVEKTVEILNYLRDESIAGRQIFYRFYSGGEIAADPTRADTGLFFFRGETGAPFAVTNAGGAFAYVEAMHDSFPHSLEIARRGRNAFALIYRPDEPYEDLARAIAYIHELPLYTFFEDWRRTDKIYDEMISLKYLTWRFPLFPRFILIFTS